MNVTIHDFTNIVIFLMNITIYYLMDVFLYLYFQMSASYHTQKGRYKVL